MPLREHIAGRTAVPEALDSERIRMHLSPVGLDLCGRIHVYDSLESTNSWLSGRLREGAATGGEVCLAETQTAGRGRRGRSWNSPAGGSLYLSLAWRALREDPDSGAATLAIGVAVADALNEIAGAQVGLKWPNDLYVDKRKLGGILVELVNRGNERYWVVGIGINLSAPQMDPAPSPWPAGLDEFWSAAAQNRNHLAGAVVDYVLQACARYEDAGFAVLQQRWSAYDLTRGQEIEVHTADGRTLHGKGGGVDMRGRLRVDCAGLEYWLDAGEVSLRLS
jgi:BirA family transcriptional regulator, biotin operon repressor / biotin---[acetyl-CoA-carboxylase] ligase